MKRAESRAGTAGILVMVLVTALLVATSPASAHHGSSGDCSSTGSHENPYACVPDGRHGVSMLNPYNKEKCRYDGTISWGDGASETVSDWKDLQTVYHQYTSHGFFTVVVEIEGTVREEGVECNITGGTHTVEVPSPPNGTPTPTPSPTPVDDARIASSTYPLTARIAKARKQLKPTIDPLVAEYNRLAEVVVMQQRAVENEAELHDFRLANLATIEGQISELRQDIADGIGSEDSAEMERLKTFLRNAQLEELAVRLRLQNKQRRLEESIVQRDGVAWQLMKVAEPLGAIDFELAGLTVHAGSTQVYGAQLASPYSRLFELTRMIRAQTENVEGLLEQKQEALKEFTATHQAASRQLIVIADLIWANAKKQAAVDYASHAVDVVNAARKGGWSGVIAEVTSKIYETYLTDVVLGDPVGDPNPGRAAIDEWVQRSAVETVGENALVIGLKRGVKETGVKVAKDWYAKGLKEDFPGIFGGTSPAGVAPSAVDDALRKASGMRERLKIIARDKLKTETFRNGFRKWFESGVGRKLLQDGIKAWFSTEFANAEMAAWAEYMQRDMHAQGWYSVWHAANNAYWEAADALVAYQLEKERILNEFDPLQLVPVVTAQETFSTPTTLRVRLVVPHSARPFGEIPIKVLVNGVQARRTWAKTFEISTKSLSGTEFAIEVR